MVESEFIDIVASGKSNLFDGDPSNHKTLLYLNGGISHSKKSAKNWNFPVTSTPSCSRAWTTFGAAKEKSVCSTEVNG
jgi:hypothetical protein